MSFKGKITRRSSAARLTPHGIIPEYFCRDFLEFLFAIFETQNTFNPADKVFGMPGLVTGTP